MAKKLTKTTVVQAPAGSGESHVTLNAGDEVPDWAEGLLGDHMFSDEPTPGLDNRAYGGLVSPTNEVDEDGIDSREPGTVPPRGGPGSGAEEWRSFARENGVEVEDDEPRDSIIAKCEAAGLVEPVES